MKKLIKIAGNEDADIDITPMLDVVFIMLIFFIVTASFVKEIGFGLYSPPPIDQLDQPSAPPIVVRVTGSDTIRIQDRVVNYKSVRPTIIRLKAENPESSVVVKIDGNAKTKLVVQAVDGIRAANVQFPSISLANI
jgi:biopolymer transport protein ExbD